MTPGNLFEQSSISLSWGFGWNWFKGKS